MANISEAKLSIYATPNPSDHHFHLHVTAKITYSDEEYFAIRQNAIRCSVKCIIWGKDYGQFHFLNADDLIYEIAYRDFTRPESRESYVIFDVNLPKGWLNEDIGEDEIYAEIIFLNNTFHEMFKRKTNVVHKSF